VIVTATCLTPLPAQPTNNQLRASFALEETDLNPDELLLAICENVACPITSFTSPVAHDALRDLRTLCVTNRRFNRVATPLLYHPIDHRIDNEDSHLEKFFKRLQEALVLRRHVKEHSSLGVPYAFDVAEHERERWEISDRRT
jgi:hypothetical protein